MYDPYPLLGIIPWLCNILLLPLTLFFVSGQRMCCTGFASEEPHVGCCFPGRSFPWCRPSLVSLKQPPIVCHSLVSIGFADKLNDCLSSCLPGLKPPSIVNCFGPNEFERTLAAPTARTIERHDFRSILDFLLMKLRTALDKDWLQKLPLLHKVVCFLLNYKFSCDARAQLFSFLFSVS